ncbi:MAG: LytTR family DNA-binding domain-containing protein [Saprospiraceae bacterium]|nr:LytTR family DNA-binding domain-containing protein [Saprospiraceae bacterium]
MKAIIVDDEAHCIGALEVLLSECEQDVKLLASCRSGSEALKVLDNQTPDVVFLDIAMPRMNGFEMLAQVDDPQFEIVFTTAYDSYALQALKVSAVDYLLKPIDLDELEEALGKVATQIRARQLLVGHEQLNTPREHWQLVLENTRKDTSQFPNIALPTAHGYEMVKAAEILYVEADGNYARIYLAGGKTIFISKTLKEMSVLLNHYGFIRVHHSSLVNLQHIQRYIRGEGGQVILTNEQSISVSRRRKPELLQALKQAH